MGEQGTEKSVPCSVFIRTGIYIKQNIMASLNKISLGLLDDSKKYALNAKMTEKSAYAALNIADIINEDFPEDQYYRQQTA